MSFWHMGGYASYIWPAYASVIFLLAFFLVRANSQLKKIKKIRKKA